MLTTAVRSLWLVAAWVATVGIIVATSIAMGASLSTTAVLLVLGIAPAIVIVMLAHGQESPSVAQILYSVETKDDRL